MSASVPSIERVGRDGYLLLEYAQQDHRTVLRRSFFRNPLQAFAPVRLDGEGCAYTQILNPTGGVVGGDLLRIEVRVGKGAHVLLTTSSATRIYRSLGEVAVQTVDLKVGPDSVLEWMPDTLIPFSGSRFEQNLEVRLAEGATLFLWDAFCSGRVARGERWAFAHFKNKIQINTSAGPSVLEQYALDPQRSDPTAPALGEGWDYFASFYVVSARLGDWPALVGKVAEALESMPGRILGGVSTPAVAGLAVRLVAKDAVALSSVQAVLWDAARREILGLPLPPLRKY